VQAYETLLITKPGLEPDSVDGLKKKISTAIEKNGGQSMGVDDWGTKRLAYEIKKFREGTYILFKYRGAGDTVRKVEDYLNLQTDVIRYLTTRMLKSTLSGAPKVTPIEPTFDDDDDMTDDI